MQSTFPAPRELLLPLPFFPLTLAEVGFYPAQTEERLWTRQVQNALSPFRGKSENFLRYWQFHPRPARRSPSG